MSLIKVESELAGTVWSIPVSPGEKVEEDDPLVMVESMKMEIPISAPRAGVVTEINVAEGDLISAGQVVVVLES
ncbi:acetyl-CoA carboxylase biotin carboxyl carrier protein subunit [Ruegeria sp. WL0004]|uniref:Biotin/lipoyl-binding protein n=2 Tax=Ruegeria TaxID=97050 RepID=A0A9Q3WNJ0_9RHOB|nr:MULTISPECIES: acetyl-CoA carboxylase biotin carboxyl carrier protein subunit [Ruegeria]MCE8539510.1 biotin/lipoyl-binding protein [Ruegeria pomeroyi]MCU9840282.1 acetyl-CoA carboxylase biotin carboxyl carrier protein subunit [Ruegeria sp. WL0004]